MKIPKRIQPLVEHGMVDEVISRLMSGKEADVFIVRRGDAVMCAKVYKEAEKRGFKQAALYQEGRKVRNSRRARAMEKGSKFGRKQQEDTWQTSEVDALGRLDHAGVRVPKTYGFLDGVLLMELIVDEEGYVAPRLGDVEFTPEQAVIDHKMVMQDVVRMLCAGLVHGDLSEFNILVDEYGPVIIDLPQAIDAAGNNNAKSMLVRDVENVTRYYAEYAPELLRTRYAEEIWALYEEGELQPESVLSGYHREDTHKADVGGVLDEIEAARVEEMERLERIRAANEPD